MRRIETIIICWVSILLISCERKTKLTYHSNLESSTNRFQEGTKISGVNNGIWIYYSDNSYQIDSVSYFENNGGLKWTKQFYEGYPVILAVYSYEGTKQLVINKFSYERMNGLKSYIYPSYLAGKNIYNLNCASCHYGEAQLNITDTLKLKKMFESYLSSDISDTMDISTLSKDNHFKLHYTNEVDKESLLMFLSKSADSTKR